jgi:tRNA(Ile)-lysidine synthase
MERKIEAWLNENKLENKKFLLAVSAGRDSMALATLFYNLKICFSIAHCNFKLRGEESDADELFVKKWCEENKIQFHTTQFNTKELKVSEKIGNQELARKLRYTFFEKIRVENNFDVIATAHHSGDQTETILFNFFRGTGIKGLSGMKSRKAYLVRPLLYCSKKEIEEYVLNNNISFREDSSNSSLAYSRNKLRNEVLPTIINQFPNAESGILKTAKILSEQYELMQEMMSIYRKKIMFFEGNEIHFPIRKIEKLKLKKTILYELLLPFGFWEGQMETIMRLLESENGKWVESPSHKLFRYQQKLILVPKNNELVSFITIEKDDEKVESASFILRIKKRTDKENIKFDIKNNTVFIDEKLIHYPLVFRKWKIGDYMYPLGMKKKKKISRLLIDEKKSLAEKEQQFVLESDKKILWAIGLRSDERSKIKASTTFFYELKFELKK